MQIDKQQVIDVLKDRGEHDKATRAQHDLPDQVDTEQHTEQLQELGVDPTELGGGQDGLRGKLGF